MTLSQLRKQIDRIDRQLLSMLNRRARMAVRIGRLKKKQGLAVFDGRREVRMMRQLTRTNRGPLPRAAVRRIFGEIVHENRNIQLLTLKKSAP